MKRTTYIMIGIFFGSLVLIIASLIYLKSTLVGANELGYKMEFSGETAEVDLEGIHTVEFSTIGMEHENYYFDKQGVIGIHSSPEGNERLTYPTSEYIKLDRQDGVLKVVVDLSLASKHIDKNFRGNKITLNDLQFVLASGEDLETVYAADRDFEVLLATLKLDTLSLHAGKVHIDSCMIGSLNLNGKNMQLSCRGLQASDLYIDLDGISWWNLDNCTLGVLHLSGSKRHHQQLIDNQYKRLVWEPKNDKAELNLNLKRKVEILNSN